ncbi:rhodanese-like domain-containing protein [Enterococcus sp. DIV0660C]|uniref:rhodanese-like domain-containing protein n=1 Tax=Enterococcus sp. DIV0660C TaxID=2230880 RepID=UPI001A8F716F|nr:rhodanese-like domain-containing protein [Enterococcus sp. DIV0660C]MBO0431727.1 rhodanese-like domain-containing protein [Enterococcus sp. DIV0660C]
MYRSIGPAEFYQETKKKSVPIIDVRESVEYQMGHVPNAESFPLSELESISSQLTKEKTYYVICQSGGRSATACNWLASEGFDVINVMGGTSAWPDRLV